MKIHEPSLDELIKRVSKGEIQLPKFQREFVWDVGRIHKLLVSLFKERPIGMATSWLQPQDKPHTDPIRFSIDDKPEREFGAFTKSPSVMSLVLDGRQRITTLLHVFTAELHARNSSFTHANRWFINLDRPLGDDDSIEWCKVNKLTERRLDSVANALSQGRYPLSDWASTVKNSPLIFSDATYVGGEKPAEEVMDRRAERLEQASTILRSFKFPIAEIGEQFDLSEVCEIFEILNTTGTRVSVFDLIHNSLFAGHYDLRETRKDYSGLLPGSRLFGEHPDEYYSQFVTTCWIARDIHLKPMGRDGQPLESLKAKNLLQTPIDAYRDFEGHLSSGKAEEALQALYRSLGGRFATQSAPYPVSLTLFIATWLATETDQQRARLHRLFRAFYYRNSLLKRYTQGYLTKHASDLRFLHDAIRVDPNDPLDAWMTALKPKFDAHFASEIGEDPFLSRETIQDQMLNARPPEGAAGELYALYLLARQNLDLLTCEQLDVFAASALPGAVQLHHLFPRKFLTRTSASYPEHAERVNCLANTVPLSRASNAFWSDKAPNTALGEKKKNWSNSSIAFTRAAVDEPQFQILTINAAYQKDHIDEIWKARAARMSSDLYHAQMLDFGGFDA